MTHAATLSVSVSSVQHRRLQYEWIARVCISQFTDCRQPDFLTSMTSPSERRIRTGFENMTPRTSDDFARCWKESPERQKLLYEIDQYNKDHPLDGPDHKHFAHVRNLEKSRHQREKSPYTLSYWGQIKLCMWREVQRIKNDPSVPLTMITVNFFEALIIASIFYNLSASTASFFSRGGVLFMMVSIFLIHAAIERSSVHPPDRADQYNRFSSMHLVVSWR
jgi:ATP-binding cassette subfamily G (WHITE) protein 2 (PDR)